MFHDALQPHGHRRDETNMEGSGVVPEKATPAPTNEQHVATNREIVHQLAQRIEVALIQTAGPEALKYPGGMLVDFLQFSLGHSKSDGLLFQQVSVIGSQAEAGC